MDAYDDRIHSPRLLGLTFECPECGGPLTSTGNLLHFRQPGPSTWGIEYECPRDKELFRIYNVSMKQLIDSILREHGKN